MSLFDAGFYLCILSVYVITSLSLAELKSCKFIQSIPLPDLDLCSDLFYINQSQINDCQNKFSCFPASCAWLLLHAVVPSRLSVHDN